MNKNEEIPEEILDLETIEVKPTLDMSQYEGLKCKIAKLSLIDVKSDYDDEGKFQKGLQRSTKVLKVETDVFATIDVEKDGKKVKQDIRASELFNLRYDQKLKKWGVSGSEKSKIQKFLAKQKVKEVKELIGTQVILRLNQDSNFMGFMT